MPENKSDPLHIAVLVSERSQEALICECVQALGHACETFSSPARLARHLQHRPCHLVVASLDQDIETALAHFPAEARPPLLLTASHAQAASLAVALNAVAADYLLAPLRRTETMTRLRVLLARFHPALQAFKSETFGSFRFFPDAVRLEREGQALDVTHKEWELALLLFRHLGQPLSRATIEETVWHRNIALDDALPSRTVDTHISRVRSKLMLTPEYGYRLAPVYGYGYCLEQITGGK